MNEQTRADARAKNGAAVHRGTTSSPALRDADAILARAAEDEAAAIEVRERYRDGGIEPIEPDARIAALLVPGEEVLAVRRSALLDRREPPLGGRPQPGCPGLPGDLYITSARLVHLGRRQIEFDLASVREAVASGERLLLILCDGAGITFGVDRPRLLRVEIAAARARQAARAGAARNTGPGDDPR